MDVKGNTILITGGATGIGFALASAFVKAGNKVIICGRREQRLKEAKARIPSLITRKCDVTSANDREALLEWVTAEFVNLNILVNNAGIQKMSDFTSGADGLSSAGDEIATNLDAPIRLCGLFAPVLAKQKSAAIFNVSSGLGFVPIAAMPVYCATKAAMHSFTVSLRHQMKNTPVKVFEIIPPAVETELGREEGDEEPGYPGIKPDVLAEEVLKSVAKDEFQIAVGEAKELVAGSCSNFEKAFAELNNW